MPFWVPGGTGAYLNTSNWSASSGGSSGAAAPTSSTDAIFDGNSGSGAVNMTAGGPVCRDFTSTGFAGTFAAGGNTLTCSGSFTCPQASSSTIGLVMAATSGTKTISASGGLSSLTINGAGGTFQPSANLSITGTTTFTNGTFNGNGFDISSDSFALGSGTKTITFGSGTWTVGSTGLGTKWNMAANNTNLIVTASPAQTGKLKFSNGSSAMTVSMGTSVTYPDVEFAGTGIVTCNATSWLCRDLIFNPDCSVKFQINTGPGVTRKLVGGGSSGHLATVQSTTAGTNCVLNMAASPDIVANDVLDFMSFKDTNATGSTIYATNSTNVSGNTNIVFAAPDPGFMMIRDC